MTEVVFTYRCTKCAKDMQMLHAGAYTHDSCPKKGDTSPFYSLVAIGGDDVSTKRDPLPRKKS